MLFRSHVRTCTNAYSHPHILITHTHAHIQAHTHYLDAVWALQRLHHQGGKTIMVFAGQEYKSCLIHSLCLTACSEDSQLKVLHTNTHSHKTYYELQLSTTLIRCWFQSKPANLLIPIDFLFSSLWCRSLSVLKTKGVPILN